jgi:hypothetical protein
MRGSIQRGKRFEQVGSGCSVGGPTRLCDVLAVAGDHTSHEIVVPAEILCAAVVDDVCSEFERSLEVRAHHSVVYDNESLWSGPVDIESYLLDVRNFEEGVCWALEQNHGGLASCDKRED